MSNDYRRPHAGRKYMTALELADQHARETARDNARQYTAEIRAAQRHRCPADPRFRHLVTNELHCIRCNQHINQINERTPQ